MTRESDTFEKRFEASWNKKLLALISAFVLTFALPLGGFIYYAGSKISVIETDIAYIKKHIDTESVSGTKSDSKDYITIKKEIDRVKDAN
jgi:hypothetical protein